MTDEKYFRILHQSRNQYASVIGTSDPNLSAFNPRKGKLLACHGLADAIIFPNRTVDYYKRVSETVCDVRDFYRFFEAPGVAHCRGGTGPQPVGELGAVVNWVDQGVAPEESRALNVTLHGQMSREGQTLPTRKLCAWPKRQSYDRGDPNVEGSWEGV
jgi:hypothetical protein